VQSFTARMPLPTATSAWLKPLKPADYNPDNKKTRKRAGIMPEIIQ